MMERLTLPTADRKRGYRTKGIFAIHEFVAPMRFCQTACQVKCWGVKVMKAQKTVILLGLVCTALIVSGCFNPLMCPFAIPGTRGAEWCEENRPLTQEEIKLITGPPPVLTVWYRNTAGQVGHHLMADPRANCTPTWEHSNAWLTGGRLPPGVQLEGPNLVGIPQIPGTWQATVKFTGLKCRGRMYPDQEVSVELRISGR